MINTYYIFKLHNCHVPVLIIHICDTVLEPVLHIEKAAAPDPVEAGDPLTYTLSYSNTGNLTATAVIITDELDPNVTYVTAAGSAVDEFVASTLAAKTVLIEAVVEGKAISDEATRDVLTEWTSRLRDETGGGFPEKVTAFREEMAVHGRYREPCPVCGSPVQRIVYSSNETNYCATCQTGGKLLTDRALSRLLKKDWPRTIEELEERSK